jgi:HEAT repeat protein
MAWLDVLEALSSGEHYYSAIFGLSGLDNDKLTQFAGRWATLDPDRKRLIADGIVEISEENADMDFGPVLRHLVVDQDPIVRAKAVSGLWEIAGEGDVELLLQALQSDTDPMVRAAAATALGHAAYLSEMDELDHALASRLINILVEAHSTDSEIEVRRRALESVGVVSRPPIQDLIASAYRSDVHIMKVAAIFAMGRSCLDRWREVITRELASSEAELRFEAVRAAGEMEDEELVWPVARLIADEDEEVRLQAIDSLGKIGGELAEKTLIGLVESSDEVMRQAAAEALEWLQGLKDPLQFNLSLQSIPEDDE